MPEKEDEKKEEKSQEAGGEKTEEKIKKKETPAARVERDTGEELAGKDTSKFSPEQMIDYIDKLKDENARRRIDNKKKADAIEKMEKKLEDATKALEGATGKLSEVEAEKKKKEDADKSDVERLTGQVQELSDNLKDMRSELETSKAETAGKDLLLKKQEREMMVDRIISGLDHEFSSDFERDGFMLNLLKTNTDGDFKLNDEEVLLEVKNFTKDRKKRAPTEETPAGGPPNRSGESPIGDQIKALTSKKFLTSEDKEKLDELIGLAGQAAEQSERRP